MRTDLSGAKLLIYNNILFEEDLNELFNKEIDQFMEEATFDVKYFYSALCLHQFFLVVIESFL